MGETEKSFTFMATQDTENDDGERVELSFEFPPAIGVTAGTHNRTVVSILDDDHPEVSVSFQTDSYHVVEGSTATVRLLLSEAPQRPVSVTIMATREGGATPDDYSVSTNHRHFRLRPDCGGLHLHGGAGRHR